MQQNEQYKSPSYYVRKRLFANKPAVFGLLVIVLAHLVASLGYLIMPDKTPDANDGSVYIKKESPIFSAIILKEHKKAPDETTSFLRSIYFGQSSNYTIYPLDTLPTLVGDSVFYVMYGQSNVSALPLVQCVRPIWVGPRDSGISWSDSIRENFYREGDICHYIDADGQEQSASIAELEQEFWKKCIEERTYYLGTDKSGRDMLSRLMFGTRISLSIGFVSVLISLILGVTLGAISGFFGGLVDDIVMWVMTVVWSIPSIMLVIIITIALDSKGIWVTFIAVGLTMWVDIARVVRGQILSIKEKLFIEAARAFGLSNRRIILRHILPNIVGPLIVISTSNFASAILIEAGLSFLGLGVQPPTPSWGIMIYEGFMALGTRGSWHLIVMPSFCISIMVLAFNLFGNGLRDAYDPQSMR